MPTNCTDLVDMRDDDVYPPICVQKIFVLADWGQRPLTAANPV